MQKEIKSLFSSESVTEGHPDKICDSIADAVLDAHLEQDPRTRINIEVLAKSNRLILSGEITSNADVDITQVARDTIRSIGYTREISEFNPDDVIIDQVITAQASEIDLGVSKDRNSYNEQGAGDQGMMFGYATNETPELMPLPITLAHRITKALTDARKSGEVAWLRPDGKAQVTVSYIDGIPKAVTDIVVSTQHSPDISQTKITEYLREELLPSALGDWWSQNATLFVNPTGSFIHGGPEVDTGLTGRKIIVDTYGGVAPHGGGSFSGKDPSKVDRSGAYFARYAARQLVDQGFADKAMIQVAYAIGIPRPVSLTVDLYGTGNYQDALEFLRKLDFRPAAIIERLTLLSPIYKKSTNYGHFGKSELPWEST